MRFGLIADLACGGSDLGHKYQTPYPTRDFASELKSAIIGRSKTPYRGFDKTYMFWTSEAEGRDAPRGTKTCSPHVFGQSHPDTKKLVVHLGVYAKFETGIYF